MHIQICSIVNGALCTVFAHTHTHTVLAPLDPVHSSLTAYSLCFLQAKAGAEYFLATPLPINNYTQKNLFVELPNAEPGMKLEKLLVPQFYFRRETRERPMEGIYLGHSYRLFSDGFEGRDFPPGYR